MSERTGFFFMFERALETLLRAERGRRTTFALMCELRDSWAWEPPMDVYEYPGRLRILIALPGADPRSVHVERTAGGLRVTARRTLQLRPDGTVHRMELPRGVFERDIELPAGAFDVELCDFTGGCLALDLVKREEGNR